MQYLKIRALRIYISCGLQRSCYEGYNTPKWPGHEAIRLCKPNFCLQTKRDKPFDEMAVFKSRRIFLKVITWFFVVLLFYSERITSVE